ncbi:MAG: CPBP family intramembrane metalloprotease [Verrucomicrobium sp.]|nr:CPBP family intramembrane metalloprotease [Verrucomicrobium sp.]
MPASSRALWGCIAFVFLGAALLSPPLYWLGHGWIAHPFHRYVDRALMLAALAGLFLFRKPLGLASAPALGLGPSPRRGKDWLGGLEIGLLSALLFAALAVAAGGRGWTPQPPLPFLCGLAGVALGAAVLAFVEEVLFRGVIQGTLVRAWGGVPGLLAGAALFALFHFIKVPATFAPQPVTWASGFAAVGHAFEPLGALAQPNMAFRFATLLAVGLVLGAAYLRTGRLWLSMGLHAGWIVGAKASQALTAGWPGHWAGGSFLENPVSLVLLFLILPIVRRWPRGD